MLPYRKFSTEIISGICGHYYDGGDIHKLTARASLKDAELVYGMSEAARAHILYSLATVSDTCVPPTEEYTLVHGISPNFYNMWGYHTYGVPASASGTAVLKSFNPGVGPFLNEYQGELFSQGVFLETANYKPGDPNLPGEEIKSQAGASEVKVFYFNPVVNAFSHYALRTGEQVDFDLIGLGFNQDDDEIDEGGPPNPDPWLSYVREILFLGQQGQGTGEWLDNFDDAIRDPAWSDQPNNGTIIEADNVLTLAVANGVNGDFWGAVKNAPICWITSTMDTITVVAKLNSYTVNDKTRAGIYITDVISGNNGVHFGRVKNTTGGQNGLAVINMGIGGLAYEAETTLPIWLRVRIQGSGTGSKMYFDYSTDGEEWTNLHMQEDESWNKIGLAAWNWTYFNAIAAPFEFFKYSWEGQPSAKLKWADGDFTLVGDDKISIPENKFPLLSVGTYKIKLRKTYIDIDSKLAEGIAGEWRSNASGLCTAGAALILSVGLMPSIPPRGKTKAFPLACFTWKNKLGETYEDCVAPIDTRAPETFYDGRIIDVSSVTRAIDHRTGLFQVSDMTIRLVNTDKKYSKLLANWFLKNQPINLWYATGFEPESSKTPIVGMIVEDYHLQGTQFVVKLKDITQKYFKKKIPPRICTELIFPQIHPDEIGKAFPEVLGLCVLGTEFENPGAVQAIYIDTLVWEYLAANGILNSVTEVYSDGELKSTPTDYSIVYRDGCTFIDFTADQEDKKVTFNAQGYSVAGLDSVNGYIQNPAYIILYYLSNILELPTELLNTTSFDALASKYDDLGVGESGKLIIQTSQDSMEVLRQLLFTYGIHGFPANDGRFMVERKDVSNYATDIFLFDQIDLMDAPMREFNLTQAINTVKARWDYIPWQRLFKDAREDYKDNKFEADMEDDVRMPREKEEPRRTR